MRTRHALLILVFGAFAFPPLAWANTGTPLLWASMLHMFVGNAAIGIGEGLLLTRFFSVAKRKSVPTMILANYFSAWFGMWAFSVLLEQRLPIDLNNGQRWLWAMVVLTYLATIVLEWPFVAWSLRGRQGWPKQSVRASFVVQSASYILLFGWYGLVSGTSVYSVTHVVAPADMSLPNEVTLYYISPNDGAVYSRSLAGGNERKVFDLHSTNDGDLLFVRKNTAEANTWDLVACLDTEDDRNPKFEVVRANLALDTAPHRRDGQPDSSEGKGPWFIDGKTPTLCAKDTSAWEFRAGFWSAEGLQAKNTKTGERIQFSYDTPFVMWRVLYPVQLPSDKLLFQFGAHQICAFDPTTKQLALLWHGRGPVAVIENARPADK